MAVRLDVKNHIATVTFERPPVNAVDAAGYEEIAKVFREIDGRDDVKVVVFTSKGKCFMAGNERTDFPLFEDPDECSAQYERFVETFDAVRNCRYPVIGAIQGHAMGAGFCYAGCCDVIVTLNSARFEMSEMNVGVLGADHFARSLMPENMVRYYGFTGTSALGSDLVRWGTAVKGCDTPEEVMEEAYKVARAMCRQSRIALVLWKECLNRNYPHPDEESMRRAAEAMFEYRKHDDFYESNHAFQEQREPVYNNK